MQQPAKVPENTRAPMRDLTSITRHLTCIKQLPRQRCAKQTSRGDKAYQQQGFDEHGRVKGHYRATGQIPEFYEALSKRGIGVNMDIFHTPERL